ncbi:FtsB family cell division protein, partial [Herbidospora cretacea]|uniref:FtsB family cell division protein n=1 Tax=Herbidospora cretacea TaxID=28444 RepID=UPI0004C31C9F
MAKRPQLTGRAAILAVVVCAIAMSLAYPVREFLAQRRQITQLEQQQAKALADLRSLEEERKRLEDPEYIKREAREKLHFCEPGAHCYGVLDDETKTSASAGQRKAAVSPWYISLWQSVESADRGQGKKMGG